MAGSSRAEAYEPFQRRPMAVSEADVAAGLDSARMDPRLMEIVTEFVRDFWWALDARMMNKRAKAAKSPFMIKAVAAIILSECAATRASRRRFSDWARIATAGIKSPAPQLLYIGEHPIGSSLMREEVARAHPSFLRHNLIAKDVPFNKADPKAIATDDAPPENLVDEVDVAKARFAAAIKALKSERGMKNSEIQALTGANRVFLSKILNNKLDGISAEYLRDKARRSRSLSPKAP
jgi:hypothetical protein